MVLVLVVSLFGLTAAAYTADGDMLLGFNDPPGAVESYKQASSIDPLDPQPHIQMAAAYMAMAQGLSDKSDAKRAAAELEKAVKLSPTYAKAYYRLAKALEFQGDTEPAVRVLKEGLVFDPHSPQLLYMLAELLETSGRHDEAILVYAEMVKVEDSPFERVRAVPELVEPLYIFAHAELGRDLEKKGDKAGALVQYQRALDRVKKYQDSVEAMHQILEAQNMRDTSMDGRVAIVTSDVTDRISVLKSGNISR
jgi:tetratricopeptide (TPR) repeat protein